jgi:uncharacterized circularly permuted ATP-grasp superfamily protein
MWIGIEEKVPHATNATTGKPPRRPYFKLIAIDLVRSRIPTTSVFSDSIAAAQGVAFLSSNERLRLYSENFAARKIPRV